MKRILLTTLVVGLLAGQASAAIYELDRTTALTFRQLTPTGSSGLLQGVFDLKTVPVTQVYASSIIPAVEYAVPFLGEVGFVGTLSGNDAWMRIGVAGASAGTYDGFHTQLANDNQSTWEVRAFANGAVSGGWVAIDPGESTWLTVAFPEAALTTFGFDVRLHRYNGPLSPSVTDTFHVSVVPVPGAILLGFLGLGAAGLKLRKFA